MSYAEPHNTISLRGSQPVQRIANARRPSVEPMHGKEMPDGVACGPLGEPGLRHGLPDGALHQ